MNRNDLEEIVRVCRPLYTRGKVASYIPELAKASPDALCLAIASKDGSILEAGDVDFRFSFQSISKIITLALALTECGPEDVFSAVGMTPIADPFNTIKHLEIDRVHKPNNPLINSGAIVVVSLVPEEGVDGKINRILELARLMTACDDLKINKRTYWSERNTSDRNRALAYFMRSVGALRGDIEDTLDVYFRQCSMEGTARDLAVLGATLAMDGVNPVTGKTVVSREVARTVRAIMTTCGMYDGSGDYAVKVGIPSKSGVGGGIVGAVHNVCGVAAAAPSLDEKGNSIAGMEALAMISDKFGYRVL